MLQLKNKIEAVWLKRKAFLARLMGKNNLALANLKEVVEKGEAGGKEWRLIGTIYARQGMWEEAVRALRQALELDKENPRCLFWLGKAEAGLGKEDAAEHFYDQALKKNKECWEILYAKGQSRFKKGDFKSAMIYFKKCLDKRPNDLGCLNSMGVCCLEDNDLKRAASFLNKALAIKPKDAIILYNCATVNIRAGEYQKALEQLEKVEDKEKGAGILHCTGYCYSKLGKYKESIIYLEKALDMDPQNTEIQLNLASVYARTGNGELSLEITKRLILKKPLDAQLLNNLAWIYETLHKHKIAEGYYYRGLALSGGDPQIAYNLACCLKNQHSNLEALDVLNYLKKQREWRKTAWSLIAQIYECMGAEKLAVDCYNKAFGLE